MTNPDNVVRLHSRNAGRGSVLEANMWCQAFTEGLFAGNGVVADDNGSMNVIVGGSQSAPDVVIATNAAGYKVALDLVGSAAVTVTAPSANSKIVSIVAYSDDLSLESADSATTGSPSSCGLIAVDGTVAASPEAPSDTQIRAAISSDGATGSQAVYAVIANVIVDSSTTTITGSLIENIVSESTSVADGSITSDKLADSAVTSEKIDWTTLPVGGLVKTGNVAITSSGTQVTVIDSLAVEPGYLYLFYFFGGGYAANNTTRFDIVSGSGGYDFQHVIWSPGWSAGAGYTGTNGCLPLVFAEADTITVKAKVLSNLNDNFARCRVYRIPMNVAS